MKCFLAFILLFLLQTNKLYAQYNLVRNYSFEDSVVCPDAVNQGPLPNPWYLPQNIPNKHAFAHTCSIYPSASIPNNSMGFQYAKTGQGYAGLDIYINFFF